MFLLHKQIICTSLLVYVSVDRSLRNYLTEQLLSLRDDFKTNGLFSDIDQKGGWGILQKSLLLEALERVTCHKGGWVSKEDVTISKQTFRVVLYPSQKTPLKSD